MRIQKRLDIRHGVCSSGDGLVASTAVPDSNRVSLNGGLSAEGADVSGVLGDFHLLDLLSEGGTVSVQILRLAYAYRLPETCIIESLFVVEIKVAGDGTASSTSVHLAHHASSCAPWVAHVPGTVFTGNADLLCSLRHLCGDAGMNVCWRWKRWAFRDPLFLRCPNLFCGSLSVCPRKLRPHKWGND